jgi:hypothetical protein|uniref:CAAD domain-containing protein n=1 Tax=Cyanobium sp. TaxID=2164130 RepID=UPI0040473F7A
MAHDDQNQDDQNQDAPNQDDPRQDGGEWQMLTTKLADWASSDAPQTLWQQLQSPLKALAVLLVAVVVLRLYAAVLGALEGVPLLAGLLELTALVWIARHGAPALLRREQRQTLIDQLSQGWQRLRD